MALHHAVKATGIALGAIAGAILAVVVLYAAAIILVVLLGLWVAARVAGATARMIP